MATISKPTLALFVISLATCLLANNVYSAPSDLPVFDYEFCNVEFGNYTTNSTYQRNLLTVLTTLQTHSSSEAFYNTSAGVGKSTVHAQYYCRGDIDATLCSSCVTEAALRAANCSNAKAGIIWYDQCTLRYKNESMYGVTDERPILASRLLRNLTSPEDFSVILKDTVSSLIQEAAYGNSSILHPRYFATAESKVSAFTTAYFLVQCSPDLKSKQCESCLLSAFNRTRTCCGEWPVYLYTFPPSCQVMYNTEGIFYFDPNAVSPPSSPPPPMVYSEPPPPPPVATPVTGSKTSPTTPGTGGSEMIRGGTITTVLVLFVFVFNG